jgi:hypothetical protein
MLLTMRNPAQMISTRAAVIVLLSMTAQPGHAEDSTPDKSGYSLFNPTPAQALRAFAPERPSKILNPFTIDAGHYQIESDILSYVHANTGALGTDVFETADPTIKLGVTNWIDLELGLNGCLNATTRDRATGAITGRAHGFGDTILKAKINLVGNDGGDVAVALAPFVKLPSAAPGLGNGVVEEGVALPAQFNLPSEFTLAVQTEVDALKKANDAGRYANFVNIVNLGHPLTFISKDLSGSIELFSSAGTDKFTPAVYTFDVGLAYALVTNVQLDAGANFGLTKESPNLNVYAGVTARF